MTLPPTVATSIVAGAGCLTGSGDKAGGPRLGEVMHRAWSSLAAEQQPTSRIADHQRLHCVQPSLAKYEPVPIRPLSTGRQTPHLGGVRQRSRAQTRYPTTSARVRGRTPSCTRQPRSARNGRGAAVLAGHGSARGALPRVLVPFSVPSLTEQPPSAVFGYAGVTCRRPVCSRFGVRPRSSGTCIDPGAARSRRCVRCAVQYGVAAASVDRGSSGPGAATAANVATR